MGSVISLIGVVKTHYWLISLVIISLGIKLWFIHDNNIMFLFDQARDARVSRQIIENRDLLIFGPTASGSNDLLYHGVLYYYLIGPVYTLAQGNPYVVALFLGLLISLSTIPSYLFAKDFTGNIYIARLVAVFAATSTSSVLATAWLSNPVLLFVTMPLFYYFLYRLIVRPSDNDFILAILAAGLCTQFFLFTAYLWVILVFVFVYLKKQMRFSLSMRGIILALTAFVLVMGSMIGAELLQVKRGLLTFASLRNTGSTVYNVNDALSKVQLVFFQHLNESFFPILPLVSVVFGLIGIFLSIRTSNNRQRLLVSLMFFGPLLFLSIQSRDSYHVLLGYQPLLLTLILYGYVQLSQINIRKRFMIIAALIGISQILFLSAYKKTGDSMYAIQKGVTLRDQLSLVDYTYESAQKKPFTISTFTNPYLYNITWDYLYTWYGKQKYGYTPLLKGEDQSIQFGIDLESTKTFLPTHFAIVEPSTGFDEYKAALAYPQYSIYPQMEPLEIKHFSTLKLVEFKE